MDENIEVLKDMWIKYKEDWDSAKEAIPKGLYDILESIISIVCEKPK